jgi:hypothetical protein
MDGLGPRPLAGTEGTAGLPFWSPDSRYLVFWAARKLQKIEATGGPAQTICDSPVAIIGGFWTPDDKIVFSIQQATGLLEVSSSGGTPVALTKAAGNEVRHAYPSLLPDGKHFVYARATSNMQAGIYLGSLDAKPDASPKKLLADPSAPNFAATGPNFGYVLSQRSGTLMALSFAPNVVYAQLSPDFDSGMVRKRFPVAAKMALATAGRAGGRAGSPRPVGLKSWFNR